jgi:hypothetical protein
MSEQALHVVGRAVPIHGPQIAHATEVEVRIGAGRQLEHLPVTRRSMAAADQADLDAIVRPDNSRVGAGREEHRAGGEELAPRDGIHR